MNRGKVETSSGERLAAMQPMYEVDQTEQERRTEEAKAAQFEIAAETGRTIQGVLIREVKKAPERAPQLDERRRAPPARTINVGSSAPEVSVETRNVKEAKEPKVKKAIESKQPAKQPAIRQKQAAAPLALAQSEKKIPILDWLGDNVPERKKNKGEEKKAAAAGKLPAERAQSAEIVRIITNDTIRVESKGTEGSSVEADEIARRVLSKAGDLGGHVMCVQHRTRSCNLHLLLKGFEDGWGILYCYGTADELANVGYWDDRDYW
ncbi:hypothetical protein HK097_006480 [Rhizophlyctis rosea]|uniref:Uncharacterized protein n=1 Tax=Rhizophlyctis rosea TaxID=64517 RepID=A0AAD5RZD4_9FUNG|nr:hypothetical protein HK097_006480 [Rhizophlyctis rosea]